jgi:periplasmic divalent cation tolerance protein
MTNSECVLVLTTWPEGREPADAFARALVEARVAACVSVLGPMRSIYRWQGATEEAEEHQVVIKTSRTRLGELRERVRALHPYDVPELLVIDVADGGSEYLAWVVDSTRPLPGP